MHISAAAAAAAGAAKNCFCKEEHTRGWIEGAFPLLVNTVHKSAVVGCCGKSNVNKVMNAMHESAKSKLILQL